MTHSSLEEGGRRYTLEVTSGNLYVQGYDRFVVDITPGYARALLQRVSHFKKVHRKDGDLREMYFGDPSGRFYDEDPDAPQEASRTECEDVVIRVDEVLWFAYPKHGDEPVMTEPIPTEDLRQIVRAPARTCRTRRGPGRRP